jgi:hypothetical protein
MKIDPGMFRNEVILRYADGRTETTSAQISSMGSVLTAKLPREWLAQKETLPTEIDFLPHMGESGSEENGYLIVPNRSNWMLCELRGREDTEFVSSEQSNMPLFGIKNSRFCFAAIVTGMPYDYVTVAGVRANQYYAYPRFVTQGDLPYEDIVVEYHFLSGDDADYSGMARCYRKYQLERGACRPLKDRIRESAELAYAAEAVEVRIRMGWKPVPTPVREQTPENEPPMHTAVTFQRAEEIMEEFHRQGIRRAEFCLVGWNIRGHDGRYPQLLPVEPALGGEEGLKSLLAKAKTLGYQVTCHSNEYDAYRIADCWDEEYLVKNKDGSAERYDGGWSGGCAYHICPRRAWERFAQKDIPMLRKLGFHGLQYLDVFTIVPPRKCCDPRHPANRGESAGWMNKILSRCRTECGGSASEGGFDFACGSLDFALYPNFDLSVKLPAAADRIVPLWQLVYHGIILYNPATDTVNYSLKDRRTVLKFLEFGGHPTMYYYSRFVEPAEGRTNWMGDTDLRCGSEEELRNGVAAIKTAAGRQEEMRSTIYAFMERHDRIAPEVYCTRYSDGSELWVNYGKSPYREKDISVPANDFLFHPAAGGEVGSTR